MSPPVPAHVLEHGRAQFIRKLLAWPLRLQLERSARRHLQDGRRQLVVFSFDHIGQFINLYGIYEKDDLDAFFSWTRSLGVDFSGGTALDIGSNIGNHALYFSDHFGSVTCFEPNPRTFQVLSINAALVANVTCRNVGLSDAPGEAALSISASNMGGSSLSHAGPGTSVRVTLARLDDQGPFERVLLVKLDVEGHELQALAGGRQLIAAHQPVILFEQHVGDFHSGQSPVVSLLQEMGYRDFAVLSKRHASGGGALRRLIAGTASGLLFGDTTRIELRSDIGPGNYNFIVAMPPWFAARARVPHGEVPA